jgi:hypothetical protein
MTTHKEKLEYEASTGMKCYVLGFMFDSADNVLLIRKQRPDRQKGFLNGIGGKLLAKEHYEVAMCREFEEETGYFTMPNEWKLFAELSGKNFAVNCYYMKVTTITGLMMSGRLKSTTDEEIGAYHIDYVLSSNRAHYKNSTVPNLPWLIAMARSFDTGETCKLFQVKEVI